MDGTVLLPRMIASGGQTGVDRAALDAAIHLGILHGGWCPLGRLAEDGIVPPKYQLSELASSKYWVRTERNVVDSDATLILFYDKLSGGTQFTFRMTQKHNRPCLTVNLADAPATSEVRDWIHESAAEGILNVAGPRESNRKGIHRTAFEYLIAILS